MKYKMLEMGTLAIGLPLILTIIESLLQNRSNAHVWRRVTLFLYFLLVIYGTIFNRHIRPYSRLDLTPFWSYQHFFTDKSIRWQIFLNIYMFVLVGYLSSWALKISPTRVILVGVLFSIFIELLQYFLRAGLCELDDVINNTLGTLLGIAYYRFLESKRNVIYKHTHKKRQC